MRISSCRASSCLNQNTRPPNIASVKNNGKSSQRIEIGRRILLPLLVISIATAVPESDASDSQKPLLQEYLKKSKENKAKNDKERLDSYYKRNYEDYFGFIEGSVKDKKEDQLTESEKGILEWLQKNKQ